MAGGVDTTSRCQGANLHQIKGRIERFGVEFSTSKQMSTPVKRSRDGTLTNSRTQGFTMIMDRGFNVQRAAPVAHSVEDVARCLSVCRRTVDREIAAGRLKAITIARRVLVTTAELDRYLAARVAESENAQA